MKKLLGFVSGAMAGAVVGAVASLLFSPSSGRDLRAEAVARWESALTEARGEMVRTQRELEAQFEQLNTH